VCLGIPMRIVQVLGSTARCEAKGVSRDVSIVMLAGEPLAVGDFVSVHLGTAIQKMSEQEAQSAWDIYDEILAAEDHAANA
jgi:hydrogenase expression/formation protein HypC